MFKGISPQVASLLSLPATFATAFGFIYAYGRVTAVLAEARLLPGMFSRRHPKSGEPTAGILLGSVLGYGFCLCVYFSPSLGLVLFNVCVCCALMGYIAQMLGFIMLHINFSHLPRNYVSPMGLTGAVYSIIIFCLIFLSIALYQNDDYVAVIVWGVIVMTSAIPYFLFFKKQQRVSKSERKVLGVLHRTFSKYIQLSM